MVADLVATRSGSGIEWWEARSTRELLPTFRQDHTSPLCNHISLRWVYSYILSVINQRLWLFSKLAVQPQFEGGYYWVRVHSASLSCHCPVHLAVVGVPQKWLDRHHKLLCHPSGSWFSLLFREMPQDMVDCICRDTADTWRGGCILYCFMLSSQQCFPTFCRSAIPTSRNIF